MKMLVYDLDGSWYLAATPEEALAEQRTLEGCSEGDQECVVPRPLSAVEMERLTYYIENRRDGRTCSFAARYYELVSRGQLEPGVFAIAEM